MTDFTQAVVHVRSTATGGAGAGFLIAPDIVLTCSHIPWNSLANSLQLPLQVSQDGTFLDAIDTVILGYNKITDIPEQNVVDNERDFALLKLAKPVRDCPLMALRVDYPGGLVTISGFPDGSQSVSNLFNARVWPTPGTENDAHKAFVTPYPEIGFSGGPLWIMDGGVARAVGIVSSHSNDGQSGMACALSLATMQIIEDWLAELCRGPAIARLYRGIMGREPDTGGMAAWCTDIAQYGRDAVFNDIVNDFAISAEFAALYHGKPTAEIVTIVYANALGRQPDADGLAYWMAQPTLVNIFVGITQSAEAMSYGSRFPL